MLYIERSSYKYCDKCESRFDKLYDISVDGEIRILTICSDCIEEVYKQIKIMEDT